MKIQKRKLNSGFTIIEVMIVLAIAGLILAIIFLAVPALQRAARNNSRRNDASHMVGLINEYASNNAGSLPTTAGSGSSSGQVDVSNENFAIFPKPTSASFFCATGCGGGTASATTYPSDGNSMDIVEGYICNPSTPTSLTAGNEHDFAVTYRIETSGGTGAASSTANNACTPGS